MISCPSQSNSPFAPWNQEEAPLAFLDKEGNLFEKYEDGLFPVYGDDLHDLVLEQLDPEYFVCSLEWLNNKLFVNYGVGSNSDTVMVEELVNKTQLINYFCAKI
jgi:hypothetical protein